MYILDIFFIPTYTLPYRTFITKSFSNLDIATESCRPDNRPHQDEICDAITATPSREAPRIATVMELSRHKQCHCKSRDAPDMQTRMVCCFPHRMTLSDTAKGQGIASRRHAV